MLTKTSSMISPWAFWMCPNANVYGLRSVNGTEVPTGLKILSVMVIASGPDTRMIPMAPPCAVAMAQMVSILKLKKHFVKQVEQLSPKTLDLSHRMH